MRYVVARDAFAASSFVIRLPSHWSVFFPVTNKSVENEVSPPPALRAGMNMRITFIAFAVGRLGDEEFRKRS